MEPHSSHKPINHQHNLIPHQLTKPFLQMKREGRQHGMVRTCRILPSPFNARPNHRVINRFDSPPTAGLFSKVPSKPTNHSKFTGKCGRTRCNECHVNPCGKSKDKAKGSRKLRSCDVVSNYRLTTWRVVDGRPGLKFSGFSAATMLEHLASDDDHYVDEYGDDYEIDHDHDTNYVGGHGGIEIQEIIDEDDGNNKKIGDDDDDIMSYCDVGFLMDQVEEDEGWCLIADM